jgi:lipopolysaccharide export system protein LptA
LNLFPGAADTNPVAKTIEVFARDLSATERQVALRGDARVHQSPITGSEPHLRCETLDLLFTTNTHRIESVRARERVHFEQGTVGVTNGPNVHSQLTADRFTANWSSPTGALSSFVAEQNVTIDAPDTKGQPSHGTAEKLTYSYAVANGVTNKTIELTGNPQLTNATGRLVGDVILWDMITDRFSTRNYRVNLSAGTNVMPKDINLDFTKPRQRKK